MINALVVLALVCQDADVSVTGHGWRHDGGYELTVSGKGKGLHDQEIVNLKFRRVVNRIRWEDGALVTQPAEDELSRTATVEKNAFVHHETFAAPGEVEVRIDRSHPDGAPVDPVVRTFRASSLPEEANAIASAAKTFDAALHGVRLMIDDLEAVQSEACPPAKRLAHLQKRIDWRKKAYREEIEKTFLTASAHALVMVLNDIDGALDLEPNGKDGSSLLSSLTGKPFTWQEARAAIDAIEADSLRERALLIVRAVEAMATEIAAGVRSGETGRWSRSEKEFSRTLETLHAADQATRSGSTGERYASMVDIQDVTIEGLLSQVQEYLHAGGNCVQAERSEECHFFELGQAVMDRAASFEAHLRTRN